MRIRKSKSRGGPRPGAGRPRTKPRPAPEWLWPPELRRSEENEIRHALTSGRLGEHDEANLCTHWETWAQERESYSRDRKWPGTWADLHFRQGLSSEAARAKWLELEEAADARELDEHRLASIVEHDLRRGDPFFMGLDLETADDLFARAEALR